MLVTGGTGFIGRRLVATLLAQGHRVRVLVRAGTAPPAEWASVETVVGDLADAVSLEWACAGMHTVLHVAGLAHAEADTPEWAARHWAINAEGTFSLLDAAVKAGVERFVFLSSSKAVGDPGPHCVDEGWDSAPESPYGQAKRAAEQRVLAVGQAQGLHVVNIRPVLVYGPGMKANLARLIEAIRRGWLPPLPETGHRRSLVHVDDVIQALLLAAVHPAAAGRTYLVTDGQAYSGRALYAIVRRALGRRVPRWAIPASLCYGAADLADGLRWLAGRRDRRMRAMLDKVLGWACYDSSRISAELGYRPIWTLERYCETEWQDLRD